MQITWQFYFHQRNFADNYFLFFSRIVLATQYKTFKYKKVIKICENMTIKAKM